MAAAAFSPPSRLLPRSVCKESDSNAVQLPFLYGKPAMPSWIQTLCTTSGGWRFGFGCQAWAVKWANPKTLRKCPTRIQLTDSEEPHPVGADFDAKPGPLKRLPKLSENARPESDPSVFRFLFRVRILSVDRADMYCHRAPG